MTSRRRRWTIWSLVGMLCFSVVGFLFKDILAPLILDEIRAVRGGASAGTGRSSTSDQPGPGQPPPHFPAVSPEPVLAPPTVQEDNPEPGYGKRKADKQIRTRTGSIDDE